MRNVTIRLYPTTDCPLHDAVHVDSVPVPDEIDTIEDMAMYIERRAESGTFPKFVFIHPVSGSIIVTRTQHGFTYSSLTF